jgi:hypothetical protein
LNSQRGCQDETNWRHFLLLLRNVDVFKLSFRHGVPHYIFAQRKTLFVAKIYIFALNFSKFYQCVSNLLFKQKLMEDPKDNDKCPVQCLKLNFCKSEYMNVYNVEHFSPL